MTRKFKAYHGVAILAAVMGTFASATFALGNNEEAPTLDSCHNLLPSDGSYELKITSTRKNNSGEMKVSFGDLGETEWETPPSEVMPFLECVRIVVGVGEHEGWSGS